MRTVSGLERRYLLLVVLLDAGRPLTVPEIVDALARRGAAVAGRPSKTVSDALRPEVRRGRVRRLGRGRYEIGRVARSSERWFRLRLVELGAADRAA